MSLALIGVGAIVLALFGTVTASAQTTVNKTLACGGVSLFCFDVYNSQLGPGDVLKVHHKSGTPLNGSPIDLSPRNGADPTEDFLLIPVGNVTTTLNCPDPACDNSINFPFVDPNVDLQFIEFGDTFVFSEQYDPNGHLGQLFAGLHSWSPGLKNGLALQQPGVYGSQAYQNRLWVTSPFFQINASVPVINVGQTNKTGIFKVLGIPDGAQVNIEPRIQTGLLDSIGQAPENQDFQVESNYP
jgi:hypothetical protein